MSRWSSFFWIIGLAGLLTGCLVNGGRGASDAVATPTEAASRPLPATATITLALGKSDLAGSSRSLSRAAPDATSGVAAVATSVIAEPVLTVTEALPFRVCSPFEVYSLQELPEIISDPYHPPPPGREERHHGVDFSHYRRGELLTIEGVDVQAVLAGQVAAALTDSFPYGNVVIIETGYAAFPEEWRDRLNIAPGESIYILYAHLQEPPLAELGDQVEACQPIGKVGQSGNAGRAHLHLETRYGIPGATFPGLRFYKTDASEAEKAAYLRWRIGGEFRHFDPMLLLTPPVP